MRYRVTMEIDGNVPLIKATLSCEMYKQARSSFTIAEVDGHVNCVMQAADSNALKGTFNTITKVCSMIEQFDNGYTKKN